MVLLLTGIAEWISLHLADKVTSCSAHDRTELCRRYNLPSQKVMVLANAVDSTTIPLRKRKRTSVQRLVFVGSQDHYPNKIAIEQIVTHILPQLDSKLKELDTPNDLTMVFIGQHPPESLLGSTFTHIALEIKDSVDDIYSELETTDIALAPLFHGSGTRIKILEYLATGNIVLATAKAVEGLSLQQDIDFLLEKRVDDYAQRIMDIVSDSRSYHRFRLQGQKTVYEHFDWNKNIRQLQKYIKSLQ
jgi:polysaccharide biosynthesis protein PslH